MSGSTGAGDVLGTVFMFINMGLLTLGGIFLSYKGLAAITHTAQDGEFMGKSFNTVWVPIRIGTGVVSLIPIAGGWSALQIVMLWIGIMGAGLGNMAWQGAVENFKPFRSFVLQPQDGSTADKNFIPNLYKMHACVESHNKQEAGSNWAMATVGNPAAGDMNVIQFGSAGGANAECGKISMSQISTTDLVDYDGKGGMVFSNSADVGINTRDQKIALAAATQRVFDDYSIIIKTAAYDFVDKTPAMSVNNPDSVTTITPYDPVQLRDWSYAYQVKMSDAIAGAMVASNAMDGAKQDMLQHAKDDGFTTAGAFYMNMAQASYAINSLAQSVSPVIKSVPEAPEANDSIWGRAYSLIESSKKAAKVGVSAGGGSGTPNEAWAMIMESAPSNLKIGPGIVAFWITEGTGEPVIIRLKNLADRMIGLATAFTVASAAAIGLINLIVDNSVVNMATAVFSGGTATVALAVAKVFLDMISLICQIALGFFLMASIYLPLVPFIIFMGQILNWLITVVEGVAAAPFLAFAHFDTDGEGLGHKTQYGYVFMLQSFMRPVMLVLGFIFSCMLLEAIGGYVMAIYPLVVANVQMDSMTGLFSIFGFIAIFYVIMVGLINTCFSVTYLLPDAIFAFIGAHSSATSQAGRNEHQSVRDAVGGGTIMARQLRNSASGEATGKPPKESPEDGGVMPSGGSRVNT